MWQCNYNGVMHVKLRPDLKNSNRALAMEKQLRACTHCGFCTAVCPTYKLGGDDNDSPRGRIYLIRELLESGPAPAIANHLDRCLGCRACETACPAGVRYAELASNAREEMELNGSKLTASQRFTRSLLRYLLVRPQPARTGIAVARTIKPLLPHKLGNIIPPATDPGPWPKTPTRANARVLLFAGCIQHVLHPRTHNAAARLFAHCNIAATTLAGKCCGGLHHHFGDSSQARSIANANVKAWDPMLRNADAIVATASGCAATLREYGSLLPDNPAAARVAAAVRDPAQIIANHDMPATAEAERISWHPPCTMLHPGNAHAQIAKLPVQLLQRAGHTVLPEADEFSCCGSAGMYSLLHPKLAAELRQKRLQQLQQLQPTVIATANIGCQLHLQRGTETRLRHWLEIIDHWH